MSEEQHTSPGNNESYSSLNKGRISLSPAGVILLEPWLLIRDVTPRPLENMDWSKFHHAFF